MNECPTGKLRHTSRTAAHSFLRMGKNKGRRMRAYLCPDCHGWHLTSDKKVGLR